MKYLSPVSLTAIHNAGPDGWPVCTLGSGPNGGGGEGLGGLLELCNRSEVIIGNQGPDQRRGIQNLLQVCIYPVLSECPLGSGGQTLACTELHWNPVLPSYRLTMFPGSYDLFWPYKAISRSSRLFPDW